MNRRTSDLNGGFTVVELVIASAIFAVILGTITWYFTTSNRAMALNEELSDRQQEVEAAINVLSYDLALAGYKGTTPTDIARSFGAPSLAIEKNVGAGGSDRLIIRYFEDSDRLFGGANTCGSPCVVTYEVDSDDGENNLYRQEGTSPERGIVQRVDHFRVIQYILRDGTLEEITSTSSAPSNLAGLNIEIAFSTGGLWRFPVGISNEQE